MSDSWLDHSEYEGDEEHHYIAWFLEYDGECGIVGDYVPSAAEIEKPTGDLREVVTAHVAASKTADVTHGRLGFYWPTRKAAQAALKAIKIALKNHENPWPEWAVKASGAGWKAPKGWKP